MTLPLAAVLANPRRADERVARTVPGEPAADRQ